MRYFLLITLTAITLLSYSQEQYGKKPKTLEETFPHLGRMFNDTMLYNFMVLPEDVSTIRLHHGLGTFLRNHWGLWRNSELKQYFQSKEIYHPDDMSDIILKSYHRHLNNIPIDLEQQAAYYAHYWKDKPVDGFSHGDLGGVHTTPATLMTYFPVGDTILISVSGQQKKLLRKEYNSLFALAVVQKHFDYDSLQAQILKIYPEKKTEPKNKVGDIVNKLPFYCYLLPPKSWKRPNK